jgi:ribonucleoside-diphosphate reductase beta chain
MVIEGMLALTGQHYIIDFNEQEGTLPGFVTGFNLVARDEHRHVAFGARFLRDMVAEDPRYKEAIQRTLEASLPLADNVLKPKWMEGMDDEETVTLFGVTVDETRDFAAQALTRRLKVIGMVPATV